MFTMHSKRASGCLNWTRAGVAATACDSFPRIMSGKQCSRGRHHGRDRAFLFGLTNPAYSAERSPLSSSGKSNAISRRLCIEATSYSAKSLDLDSRCRIPGSSWLFPTPRSCSSSPRRFVGFVKGKSSQGIMRERCIIIPSYA